MLWCTTPKRAAIHQRCKEWPNYLFGSIEPYYTFYHTHFFIALIYNTPNMIIPSKTRWDVNAQILKGPYADHILIPRVQAEVVLFLVSNESPYFTHYNPQISASNSLYFGNYSRKCTDIRYTNFYILMYFHNSLIPILVFAPWEKKKVNFRKICAKCVLGVKVKQFRVEIAHVKMGTTPNLFRPENKNPNSLKV